MATALDPDPDCLLEVPIRLSLSEVERLTQIIERFRRAGLSLVPEQSPADEEPARLATFARFILTMRRRRDSIFPLVEFGEPAWDMLLDLYVQHVEGQKVSVTSLCAAAGVPPTTALRWLDAMAAQGVFVRSPDPQDGRRVIVSLAPEIIAVVEHFLIDMRRRGLVALQ